MSRLSKELKGKRYNTPEQAEKYGMCEKAGCKEMAAAILSLRGADSPEKTTRLCQDHFAEVVVQFYPASRAYLATIGLINNIFKDDEEKMDGCESCDDEDCKARVANQ